MFLEMGVCNDQCVLLAKLLLAFAELHLPGSPPATDSHPLAVRAQASLDPFSTSWASQLRIHQTVSTPHLVLSVPGSRVEAGL